MEPLIEGRNELTGAPLPEDWADRLRCFMNRVRFHMERGDQENDATAQARLGFGHLLGENFKLPPTSGLQYSVLAEYLAGDSKGALERLTLERPEFIDVGDVDKNSVPFFVF